MHRHHLSSLHHTRQQPHSYSLRHKHQIPIPRIQSSLGPSSSTVNFVELTKVYCYFQSLRKNALRKICRRFGRRISGKRPELIYRRFLFIKGLRDNGKDIKKRLGGGDEFQGYMEFLIAQERNCMDFTEPPPIGIMLYALKCARNRPEVAQNPATGGEVTSSSTSTSARQSDLFLQNCTKMCSCGRNAGSQHH